MDVEAAISIIHGVIVVSLTLVGPFLGVAIFVGVVISLIQTVTSIQDQTLTFVPKLVVLLMLVFAGAHWALKLLMEFTIVMFQHMPEMVR